MKDNLKKIRQSKSALKTVFLDRVLNIDKLNSTGFFSFKNKFNNSLFVFV